ncbi:NAD-dependent epimerase/dehydratase family protein [Candidatus Micrarchaeota archaeon]|nr:NAD-dependent epimerase/dehydratase family protein [Candidatus Micrarchaeota archaeon]
MAAKIFITGATGRLGSAVLKKTDAIPLVRKRCGLPKEIVTDFSPESLKKNLAGADAVIHIAGSVDTANGEKMQQANVELTGKIIDAVPEKAKIIFAGSISVYGKKMKEIPADEETPVSPDSRYAKTKYDAEEIVRKHTNHVILRLGTVYGPGFDDFFYVIRRIKEGKMRIIGSGKNRVPFVHADDAAEAFVNAIGKGQGTYVICGESLPQERIFEIASGQLKVEMPGKISEKIALWLAGIAGLKAMITGKKVKMTAEHIRILASDREFDCAKAKKELGFSPRSLADGIKEMLNIYEK